MPPQQPQQPQEVTPDQAIAIAIDHYNANQIEQANGSAHNNLGNVLQVQGRIDEAVAEHRRAVELAPDNPWNNSNLLRDLNYSESISPQELLAEHRAWWDRHGRRHAAAIAPH